MRIDGQSMVLSFSLGAFSHGALHGRFVAWKISEYSAGTVLCIIFTVNIWR